MDITHVLLRNDELDNISKQQRSGSRELWQTSLHNPGFAAHAVRRGGSGLRGA